MTYLQMIWKLFNHFTQFSSVFANILLVSIWLIRIAPAATGLDLFWTVYEESGFFRLFVNIILIPFLQN